ncbi:DUF6134 family protein [Maricaulis virginensis]|uniref:DUF3108 domain-containing protein n=1 Tax=Maricaulis virginensis TaxID=144022 RepID=A0A9W6IME3_9PROT|nr:DUF6134 family protein [Maricaulis virginensis]GLK52207.1 hypothetical protein GCM10017621_17150 [Maricaulis virginensis]
MKTLVLTLLSTAFASPAPVPAEPPADIVFDVLRNGQAFGRHEVRFDEGEAGELLVDIDIELRAGLGPITVFRYEHAAEEVWRDGQLVSLEAETLKDGDRIAVDVERGDTGLIDLMPSSHWLGYDPAERRILNTETGEAMPVEIEDLGLETVETASGEIEARRIRMTGTLTVDLWYDAEGRWVGCAFEARGQSIRYVLQDA